MGVARLLLALLLVTGSACDSAEPPTAPDAVPVEPGTPIPVGMGTSAAFVRTGYNVSGRATLTIETGVAQLDFSSDFAIAEAPGPVVYLNTGANPNAGEPIRVGALRSLTGAQRYTFQVPAGVRYTHIIIWCDPFNVGMAHAIIPPTP